MSDRTPHMDDPLLNRLSGLRAYLAGPIDHAVDDGVAWRNKLGRWLQTRGIIVIDPCRKPLTYHAFKEIGEEKRRMMDLKTQGRYFELSKWMRGIVHVDLRMVDVSDIVIVYLDIKSQPFGTVHELINAINQRKPTLVVVEGGKSEAPNWLFGIMRHEFIFDDFEEMRAFLTLIDTGTIQPDYTRWVFLDDLDSPEGGD
jgi:nucleoside 2-deoxyribosyltransferase